MKIILNLIAAVRYRLADSPTWRALCYAFNMADDNDHKPILKSSEEGAYQATPEERAGIARGLKDAREGRFATDEQIERLFEKHRPA